MGSSEVLLNYIKKLDHPMKEIRERSLQLIIAKLKLGWRLDDELLCTRNLLENLLAWFKVQKPTLQFEALSLLLNTIKTKSGMYIIKELGVREVLSNLKQIKSKVIPEAIELFHDVVQTLQFLNTAESENDMLVPPLSLDGSIRSGNQNSCNNDHSDSNQHSDSNDCGTTSKINMETGEVPMSNSPDGITVFLLPWVDLCPSDLKTIVLVEDALKVVKSTRRCCRFIRDVFLRDFEPEIFLNRSAIINTLLLIADGQQNGHVGEALRTLLCITRALRQRLAQLFCIDLIHRANKVPMEGNGSYDEVNAELANIAGGCPKTTRADDALIALRQMPAPTYALDVSHSILSIMSRSVLLLDSNDSEALSTNELNICLDLVESLIQFLLDCVDERFWLPEHSTKSHKDIAHKSCMLMRILGELLIKYRKSFMTKAERGHHRAAWLRLLSCAGKLLDWAQNSPLPPSSLIVAVQSAQLDPALELLYPELSAKLNESLLLSKSLPDQEHKNKYKALKNLFVSMDYAVRFMKKKEAARSTKEVLTEIENSLPTLGLHHSEAYFEDIANILLYKSGDLNFDDGDWSTVRSISLRVMAHNTEWVKVRFYQMFAEMVRSVLLCDDTLQAERERCLFLLCDVAVLTEICCHGLSSQIDEVKACASDIMLHLLRGRLVLSESCWWRLLASMLPILPLLHVYAAHDTQLGIAICKSLEPDIIECMGVSFAEMVSGLTRLLFVRCVAVQLEAAHALCRLLGDDRYLPPKESLRSDILLNALRRLEPQDFNLDKSSTVASPQTAGLVQVLEVLKQDLEIEEGGKGYVACTQRPGLEPSLRRSTLQQLAVLLRQSETHDTFLQHDGLNLVVSLLRLSLMIDDYLAFPECAISCVSVLNSVCFASRHDLSKVPDLPLLLLRVILVFPSNDACVSMSAQLLSLVAWSGFVLQEINSSREKVPALPLCVTERTSLPFPTNSYWSTSANAEHCPLEWLQSEEEWRRAIRVHWWWAWTGGAQSLRGVHSVHSVHANSALAPPPAEIDLALMRAACPVSSSTKALLALENATSHSQVMEALYALESYTSLVSLSSSSLSEYGGLPWQHIRRFLCAPPASPADTTLLVNLLQFVIAYMDNVPNNRTAMCWLKPYFIGNDVTVITLLSRERLYPQQTPREDIEMIQLRIHIVKIIWRCVRLLETQDDYDIKRMESLLKILFACLDKINFKNFHMLGYLNEVIRCIRYALHSRYCKLTESSLLEGAKALVRVLGSGDGGRKGQACRLDAMIALLAILRQIRDEGIPVQRWSEYWSGNGLQAVVACSRAERVELRAAALHAMATLTHYAQLRPQLLQSIPNESLCQYAMGVFLRVGEANVVRSAAADLLAAVAARTSSHSEVYENEIIEHFRGINFVESCLQILVEFCNEKKYQTFLRKYRLNVLLIYRDETQKYDTGHFQFTSSSVWSWYLTGQTCSEYKEPNLPLSVLERRSEFEVRAHKTGDVQLSPAVETVLPPPTAGLVTALADVLNNVSAFKSCPVESWNDQGVYRVLLRCASWRCDDNAESNRVRAATCRALVAAATRKCVRASLAATKDCLVNLLHVLTSDEQVDGDETSARAQTFQLFACLLSERSAIDSVWSELRRTSYERSELREREATPFFHLLTRSLESADDELSDAATHCLTQLTKSALNRKHADKSIDVSLADFFNDLRLENEQALKSNRSGAGDADRGDGCQPEYVCEELCKLLIYRVQDIFDKKKCLASQDEAWASVCSCLSHLLSVSSRGRLYGVHRQLPRLLLAAVQAVRDQLSLLGKPVDVIRNANHDPVLQTLYWLLTIMNCLMLECPHAKDSFADNITCSLNKLWPWCMMTEQLRGAILHLLVTFTNECPKAWACMCACVGGRSLMSELCALVGRSSSLLLLSLRILRQCVSHHHCRAIILKSEVLACMGKAWRGAGGAAGAQCAWARLCSALARHPDGGGALLALPALRPAHARLLPALAYAAHHHRAAFLHAPDLLELLSATLLTGNTADVVLAARAVWALAANNHRAKLVLRSAGVTSAVQSAMQRVQRDKAGASSSLQALQLLTYTNSVLQAM